MLSSNIKDFLIKIICVVLILSIILLIIPNGKTKGTIKLIFSIIISLFFISPLLKIKNSEYNLEPTYYQENIDENYLSFFLQKKEEKYKNLVKEILETKNIKFKGISVFFNKENVEIESILIEIEKQSILKNDEHIVFIDEIKETVSSNLFIDKERVNINEN